MKNRKNNKWMILGCIAPIILFIGLKLLFPSFAYLSILVLLICPLLMFLMMRFMNKDSKPQKIDLRMKSQISIKRNKKIQNISIILIVVVIGALFFYVANKFGGGESGVRVEKPITYCQPENAPPEQQKCFYTAHDHFSLKLIINGKEQEIEFEKGDLQKSHTHAQKGKVHWHSLLPVDSTTKQIVDWAPHSLKSALQDLGFDNFFKKKVTIIVNGQVETKALSYIWQDGDIIEVRFE